MSKYIKKSELLEWLKFEASPHTSHWKELFSDGVSHVIKEIETGKFDLKDLPQASDSTEILNEVKADKGILTEEELKEYKRHFTHGIGILPTLTMAYGIALIDEVYRLKQAELNYLSANAELSFKNQKYKDVIDKVWKHAITEGIAINNLQNALEELK